MILGPDMEMGAGRSSQVPRLPKVGRGTCLGEKAPTSSMEGQFFTKEKEPNDILFLNTFICFVFP